MTILASGAVFKLHGLDRPPAGRRQADYVSRAAMWHGCASSACKEKKQARWLQAMACVASTTLAGMSSAADSVCSVRLDSPEDLHSAGSVAETGACQAS